MIVSAALSLKIYSGTDRRAGQRRTAAALAKSSGRKRAGSARYGDGRRAPMCARYKITSSISRSLIWSAGKPGIRSSGQLRTDFGSRISACSPARVKYSVGFIGWFKSGPIVPAPAPLRVWQGRHWVTKRAWPARTGCVAGNAGSTPSAGQRAAGDGWLASYATWYGHCSLRIVAADAPVHKI